MAASELSRLQSPAAAQLALDEFTKFGRANLPAHLGIF
jgi:hypothetical protein